MREWLNREISLKRNWDKFLAFILIFQSTLFLLYYTFIGHFQFAIANYGLSYWCRFYLVKVIPLYVIGFYFLIRKTTNPKVKAASSRISWVAFVTVCFSLVVFVSVFILNGFPLKVAMGNDGSFDWYWAGVIEWAAAFLGGFALMHRKTKDPVVSSVFATMLISAGGMFYELPIYHLSALRLGGYFDISFPFFVATEFFSFFFMWIILYFQKWKPEKWFYITLSIYVIHGIWYFNHPNDLLGYRGILSPEWRFVTVWIPRAVGIAFLWSLPAGIKALKEKQNAKTCLP